MISVVSDAMAPYQAFSLSKMMAFSVGATLVVYILYSLLCAEYVQSNILKTDKHLPTLRGLSLSHTHTYIHTHTHTHLCSSRKKLPPVYKKGLPLIGPFLAFAKNPIGTIREAYEKEGNCFTMQMFNIKLTFLVGPGCHELFFKASDAVRGNPFNRHEIACWTKYVFT